MRGISNHTGGFGKGPESCRRNPGSETQPKKGAVFGPSELHAVSRAGGEEKGGGEAGVCCVKGPLCFPAERGGGMKGVYMAVITGKLFSPREALPWSLRRAMGLVLGPLHPWSHPEDSSWPCLVVWRLL